MYPSIWLFPLSHGLGAHAGATPSLPLALLLGAGAGLVPLWVGAVWAARRHEPPSVWTKGVVAGFLVFLLIDLLSLTANLGMGLTNWGFRALLVTAFAAGALAPAAAAAIPAYAWAAGIGLHSLGEGFIMGHNLHKGLGVALQILPLSSFILHKLAEGFSAGLLLRMKGAGNGEIPAAGRVWSGSTGLIALIAGLPAIAGVAAGYTGISGTWGNVAYAAGAGALVWVLPRFLQNLTEPAAHRIISAAMALGVILMYLAGILHEL